MRPPIPALVAALLLAATPALASYGTPPPQPQTGPASSNTSPDQATQTPRQRAEPWYRDAYDDVVKGGQMLERGDEKGARKRYRRALERSREAVEADSTYAEAWNLVGFTSRKLGDYAGSFAAYAVAVRQKPDFALAHEYWGEGLLETGDLAGAREHLAALRRIGDAAMIAELQAAIDKYAAAHADSAATGANAH